MHLCVHRCMSVEVRDQPWLVILRCHPSCFLSRVFYQPLATNSLDWLAREAPESTRLHLLMTGLQVCTTMPTFFRCALGTELKSSGIFQCKDKASLGVWPLLLTTGCDGREPAHRNSSVPFLITCCIQFLSCNSVEKSYTTAPNALEMGSGVTVANEVWSQYSTFVNHHLQHLVQSWAWCCRMPAFSLYWQFFFF